MNIKSPYTATKITRGIYAVCHRTVLAPGKVRFNKIGGQMSKNDADLVARLLNEWIEKKESVA